MWNKIQRGNEKKNVPGNRNGIEKTKRNAKYRITIIKFIYRDRVRRLELRKRPKRKAFIIKFKRVRQFSPASSMCVFECALCVPFICATCMYCGVYMCECACVLSLFWTLSGSAQLDSARFLIEQIICMHGQVLEKRPNDNCTHFVYIS